MEKRLKCYLSFIDKKSKISMSEDEKKELRENLLEQIGFFQHERFIHLIVTVTFALVAMLSLIMICLYENIFVYLILFMVLILLFPYIRHYFILERGVQKLYQYYDILFDPFDELK
nr:hypothetical protein [Sedimentibacter sp.]